LIGKKVWLWRILFALAMAWVILIAVLYALQIGEVPPRSLRVLLDHSRDFFLWQAAGFLLVTIVVSVFSTRFLGRACALYLSASSVVLLILCDDPHSVGKFLLTCLWFVSAVGTIRLGISRCVTSEHATLGLSCGVLFCALVPVSFFYGLVGAMSPWPVAVLAVASALPGLLTIARERTRYRDSIVAWLDGLSPWGVVALGAIWLTMALAYVGTNVPEIRSDAVREHLPYIQRIVGDGVLSQQYIDFKHLMVYGLRTVHAMGYTIGSIQVAKLLSWLPLVALAVLVGEEVSRRCGRRNLGLLASAVIITNPVLLELSGTLFHDPIITLVCTTAFVALFRGLEQCSRTDLMLAAFAMGCAAQTKYNVLIFAVVWAVALVALAVIKRGIVGAVHLSLLPLVCLGLSSSPWYIYTFVTTGSPVFPYMNELFHSPFWPEGLSTAFNHAKFTFGDSIWSKIFFPWSMTFHAERLGERGGALGFQLLALSPLVLLYLDPRWRKGAGLGLAGLACLVAVCLRTPYARYWLPIYPLLLIPLVLSLGELYRRIAWTARRCVSALGATLVFSVLLITVPFWTERGWIFPWDVYTGETSSVSWLEHWLKEYEEVRDVTKTLERNDRVVVTGFNAIAYVGGDAYPLSYWSRKTNAIKDMTSLNAWIKHGSIRYWLVNFASMDSAYFERKFGMRGSLWSDSRLVAGSGSVALYDVLSDSQEERFVCTQSWEVGPVLQPGSRRVLGGVGGSGWWNQGEQGKVAKADGSRLAVPIGGRVIYVIRPPDADLCRIIVDLVSDHQSAAIVSLIWLDGQRRPIDTSVGWAPSARGSVRIHAPIPRDASLGWLLVRQRGSDGLGLGTTTVEFWERR
jgi:hypothetical protein